MRQKFENQRFSNRCFGAAPPSNANRDTQEKLYLYERSDVREYWIADPEAEKVVIYPFGTTRATGIHTFDDDIPVGIYGNSDVPLTIRIKDK